MKSLSLSVPHVVVMVGLPGSGKSFFAEHFRTTFSAPLVSWNNLRTSLFNEPSFSKNEEAIIKRVADSMLDELLKTRATIIYEGDTLSQASRQALAKKVRQAGYEPLFVWVQTDVTTTKTRATKKAIPADVQESASKRFTSLKESDNYVVISGKHTYASQLKIVLRKLSAARTHAAERGVSERATNKPAARRMQIQ